MGTDADERRTVALEIAGESVELLPERAAFWRAAGTLLVSDLHLGKEHAFAAFGVGIPETVLDETLARLERCIELTAAERVLVLGDLVHARQGTTEALIERVGTWRRSFSVAFGLVPGNHDREAARVCDAWGFALHEVERVEGPFRFVHVPPVDADGGAYTFSGHEHPGVRLEAGGDSVRLPAFRIGDRVSVLPAFSKFTGRMTSVIGRDDRLFGVTDSAVIPVAAREGSARRWRVRG